MDPDFSIEDEVEYLRSKVNNLTFENINMSAQIQRLQCQLDEKTNLLNLACKIPTKRHRNSLKYKFYHENKESKQVQDILQTRYNNIFETTGNKPPWQLVKQITDELYTSTVETSSSDC